ncbi:hypothetical protein [Bifidobacterium oedipodis]|uniref:Tail fiber protein n=1 Tax=Bifidobacterium oedipodis TaxID=2675322 RepID=A0A7Y0ENH6_9BIFI|nr:hypothetical protein [Bifidobacterium sp. DSM 109957]NMM93492.1 tail fiber protein [Bifidobacterium sp. DSM 109957]
MEIEKYRTIEATLDLADDYAPPIRLNAGDVNGRILKFNITDGGNDVDDLNGLSAQLTWNRDPTDPASAGGYRKMTVKTNTDNSTGVRQVTFTAPVPRALLQQAGERTVLGLDIEDAEGNVIASRSIPVLVEPSRLNPKAAELADPLKELHGIIDDAHNLIDTAAITMGTVATLTPAKKASATLTGSGWQRKLNLSIPRGTKISQITATALDSATPTVSTSTDGNGDMIVALGLPRGKQGVQGDPGPKGDPGDVSNVPVATAKKAGIVRPSGGIGVLSDGSIYMKDRGRWYSRIGEYASPFDTVTVLGYSGRGSFYDPIITFTPNMNYESTITGPVEITVLSENYRFESSVTTCLFAVPMLKTITSFADGLTHVGVRVTTIKSTGNVRVEFLDETQSQTTYNLHLISSSDFPNVCSPAFTCVVRFAMEVLP